MAVSLYAVRLVFNGLGVENYGIYGTVSGFVLLLSFLGHSMQNATQRYFSFALGENNFDLLRKTFNTNLVIYLALNIAALVFFETAGLYFVSCHLSVPPDRLQDVIVLYHLSVCCFPVMLLTQALVAIIVAHEDMKFFVIVSIIEAALNLMTALFISFCRREDLVVYGWLLLAGKIIVLCIYAAVCRKAYPECRFRFSCFDRKLLREIWAYTWWMLFGHFAGIVRNQGVTVLLNQYFTPVAVAARSIAASVSGATLQLSFNFSISLSPPTVKAYAQKQMQEMYGLIHQGTKLTFYLMWVLSLPLVIMMPYILKIWLKNPPEWAVLFSQLALIEAVIESVGLPLSNAARALEKMRFYESVLGGINLLVFLFSWLFLYLGYPPQSIFIIAITASAVMLFVRLLLVHYLIALPVMPFLRSVCLPCLLVVIASALILYPVYLLIPVCFVPQFLFGGVSVIAISFLMLLIAFRKEERKNLIRRIKGKIIPGRSA